MKKNINSYFFVTHSKILKQKDKIITDMGFSLQLHIKWK